MNYEFKIFQIGQLRKDPLKKIVWARFIKSGRRLSGMQNGKILHSFII